MTRVLLVGKGTPERGGIPSFLALLLDSRLAREHDLALLNLGGRAPVGGRATPGNVMRTAHDAARVWKAARPVDLVHIHSALAPGVTLVRAGTLALAGRLAGARTVVHGHGGRIQLWLNTPLRRRIARLALGATDTVVAVSAGASAALVEALPGRSVLTIENGVDTVRFSPRPGSVPEADVVRILYAGSITSRKGVLDLLAASDRMDAAGVAHEVVLVGGVPDEGAGAADAVCNEANTRAGRVTLAGAKPLDEMPEIYRSSDIFCLASWWEAMPLSVLEAMATGLPVVATDVGDVSRMVEHGVTGFVVPPHDPEALADALVALVTDAERRRRMGAAGRGLVEARWNADRTVERLSEMYVASEGRRR